LQGEAELSESKIHCILTTGSKKVTTKDGMKKEQEEEKALVFSKQTFFSKRSMRSWE